MRLSGNKIKVLFLILSLFQGITTFAQEVDFTASAPKVVRSGEQFRLTYTVSGDHSGFQPPSMSPFRVLSGPDQSQSSSFQFINGKTSTSKTTTYSYWLRSDKVGTFTLPAATITINRKKKQNSNALNIQVVSGKSNGNVSSGNSRKQKQTGQSGSLTNDNLFALTQVSKKKVYLGEQFVVSQKIYTTLNLAGFGDIAFPSYGGFWAQEVEIPGRVSLQRESYNNTVYGVGELKRTILFPQKSGELTIEPAEIEVVAQVQSQNQRRTGDPFYDSFFGNQVSNVTKNCVSDPVKITVMPLPEAGKPAGFSGAVGTFSINSTIDKTELSTNEAITIKYRISGTGNLQLIDLKNVRFPHDFEVFDPKVSRNINTNNNSLSGNITFEYVLIPRNAGTFSINSLSLVYFDPQKAKYVTLKSPEYLVTVKKGDVSTTDASFSGLSKEEVKLIGEDIRYIKSDVGKLSKIDHYFFLSKQWVILVVASILLFIILLLSFSIHKKNHADHVGMRNRKATQLAKMRLKKAEGLLKLNNVEGFYEEVSTALWGYLGDKLNIPVATLNVEYAKNVLETKNIPVEITDQFIALVEHCDYARFAPGDLSSGMKGVYAQSMEIITSLEKGLK